MMMGWKSACGVLQHAHRRLWLAQPFAGAGLPADMEVRRDRALPRAAAGWLVSLVTIYLDGISLAELAAVHQQAVVGTMTPEVGALQEIWSLWGIPSQAKKGRPPDRRMGNVRLQSRWGYWVCWRPRAA